MRGSAITVIRLRRRGLRPGEIARACGVETVLDVVGPAATDAAVERLEILDGLVNDLADSLRGPGPGQWLRSGNRLLGGRRPIDVLAEGGHADVRNAVGSYTEGGFV